MTSCLPSPSFQPGPSFPPRHFTQLLKNTSYPLNTSFPSCLYAFSYATPPSRNSLSPLYPLISRSNVSSCEIFRNTLAVLIAPSSVFHEHIVKSSVIALTMLYCEHLCVYLLHKRTGNPVLFISISLGVLNG